jgi:hypothetical protein
LNFSYYGFRYAVQVGYRFWELRVESYKL